MSRARTWRSNTAGRRVKSIGCRRWQPIWFAERSRDRRGPRCRFGVGGQGGNHDDPHRLHVPEDPVRLGLVASLSRPGGNLTGVNFVTGELAAKRLELLHELVPAATRVAVLVNPATPAAETTVKDVEPAAHAMGLQIQVLKARHQPRDQCGLCNLCPRATRRPVRRRRLRFLQPTGANCHPGGAPRDSGAIFDARVLRSRRADELRVEPSGGLASGRDLYRPRPQGCQAGRLASGAGNASSSWSSTPRPPGRSASRCRRRCSRLPTR